MANTTTFRSIFAQFDREAWFRFFVALGGLAIAFGAAIYSTVFRQEGNLFATAISASLALLAAGFVGLYTVPYLAKRVALETVKEAFDYDVTREGIVYLGAALLIGVAALNTGNNLLFIIVAAMLAAVIVSGVASAVVLRGLRLEIILPNHVFAKQSVMARVHVRNALPIGSFSVSLVPAKQKGEKSIYWEKGIFAFPPNKPKHQQWLRLPDLTLRSRKLTPTADSIFHGSIYYPFIAGRETVHADAELTFPRRGRYIQNGFGFSTRFPFSFLVKTRRIEVTQELLVYPPIEQTDEFLDVLPMIRGEHEAFVRGRGYDLYRIREHQPGDPARHVDWKATAKSGALKVREFTREDERKLRVIFDNPPTGIVTEAEYEKAVALAASLAWHFSGTDAQLSFAAPGLNQPGSNAKGIYDFLRYLALVQPSMVQPSQSESLLGSLQPGDEFNLIITAQPRGSLPTALWASSYVVFMQKK